MTAKTRKTMMNIDAVMGRTMPKERRTISNAQTANAQMTSDDEKREKTSKGRAERRSPAINEPSTGMTFSENLAGKGFNPQMEASYKGSHPDLDFRSVDAIEHYQVSSDALTEFLKDGGLSEP